MPELPLIARAQTFSNSVALRSDSGERTYNELLERSATLATVLLGDENDLKETRVAFLVPAGFDYVAVQWAIWRAGGVAVPLSLSATESELEHALADSASHCVVAPRELAEKVDSLCQRLGLLLLVIDEVPDEPVASDLPVVALPDIELQRRAMILYTSGTTAKPKGVVSTHANIQSQIVALVQAWAWQTTDRIPLFLPLHHIHGIINVVSCALWSGATIEPLGRFDIDTILDRVAADAYTVFMAVPTIYVKLIQALEVSSEENRARIVAGFAKMRLMVSGSAALPASVHETWTALTGQKLLERYGMTEIGMALSNPYDGARLPGTVGQPLPSVQIRLKSEQGELVTADGEPGEIQVRGPAVFGEYWNLPDVTSKSFDDGWFRTGDIAFCENGYYRIMGRQSVDIIKSGGYKLSALEIEAALLEHPAIRECAVVGVSDDTWGEAVAVAVVLNDKQELDLESLRLWCRDRLSRYKIPHQLLVVDSLPRNAMGKVTKPAVAEVFKKREPS
ncbi:MAG: acyl-CoA synthetase [Pirellulaceae bacterium]|jgi:malonyl-CoA/methylmalonyl-CoA synthetase|nr:acyl-CoA synthetase [Pirellulaceae bacterium]MDP6555110.1 acyl-CoA synthetase [Pirellulaceae bacterium]